MKNKWTLKDFVYLTKDEKTAEGLLWKYCFENKNNLTILLKELGWQGGTIHQVLSEIIKMKNEIKKERPETYKNIQSGKMKLFSHKFLLE